MGGPSAGLFPGACEAEEKGSRRGDRWQRQGQSRPSLQGRGSWKAGKRQSRLEGD